MVEGFWIVQYEGVQGNGGGVVIFLKGHVLGGDTGFIYTGTYQTDEKTISARVLVRNFLPGIASVLGVQGDFELTLKGTVEGQTIKAGASVANQQVAGLVVKLTRVSDLPG
ncbi:MAG TPA: GrlR family regulatory protein [Terriglobia bacterium]|nr:GrlR family regulatory protein [Terriglobia bacterium]